LIDAPSPNFDARKAVPDCVILHYTGMETGEAALERLRDPEAKVSAHYMVDEDGRSSAWCPRSAAPGTPGPPSGRASRTSTRPRSASRSSIPATSSATALPRRPDRRGDQPAGRHPLALDDRRRPDPGPFRHRPGRKIDPGELFPWKRLAEAGHGLWVEPPPSPGAPLGQGEEGTGVFALQAGLTRLGYNCAPSGKYDEWTTTVVAAFQRHWLQTRFDGVADGETRARLVALLRAAPADASGQAVPRRRPRDLLAFIRAHPFVTIAAAVGGRPFTAQAPVVIRELDFGEVALDFHLSRGNALAPHLVQGFRAVALATGPDAYVSPDWYGSDDQVPTWNYVSAEAEGSVAPLDDDEFVALLDDLSAQEEARLLPKKPWTRDKMSPGRFEPMMRGIIGCRLIVERLEGHSSSRRTRADAERAGAVAGLGGHPIAELMRSAIKD
jgi:transcriptional regulator